MAVAFINSYSTPCLVPAVDTRTEEGGGRLLCPLLTRRTRALAEDVRRPHRSHP